jgi:AcrR family transcriptional regulator
MTVPSGEDSPRSRRRHASRERILEAAGSIVHEEGIDALSLRRVAALADYTVGALYRYFDSRDALLIAVAEAVLHRLAERMGRALDDRAGLEAVCRAVDAYRDFAQEDAHGFALITSMIADPRLLIADGDGAIGLARAIHGLLYPVHEALVEAVLREELEAAETVEEGERRIVALFGALQGALQWTKLERRVPVRLPADRLAKDVVTSMLIGWGAERGRVRLRDAREASDA